ncbi:MAG TPA: adenylosuccinate lyase [Bacteroidales bacterium]|nr:adenylosuccinate lyase [Bacteroidales bacterium]HPT00952.1 adenylosuccinate lyase [Bacteroidales bacterium]
MELSPINAISPVDGRYRKQVENLSYYFSEAALINYRVFVEVEYFVALCNLPLPQLAEVDKKMISQIKSVYRNFTFNDAQEVKEIEAVTNHDVKAVEYFLKKQLDKAGLGKYREFVHFGLTSQDINNTAMPYALKQAMNEVVLPIVESLVEKLLKKSKEWQKVSMLARTHGQPASPTLLGKEMYVFVERLKKQLKLLKAVPFEAKFGGATGNMNAHYIAYPDVDWIAFADTFVKKQLGLERQHTTTQIEHYDSMAALFDALKRINTILINFSRDIWSYISMEYFRQKITAGEVGSSTMPHKVNPIDFENAEGNLAIANAIFEFLSSKLPVSRLQRDLTDSTVSRNIGVPLAHMVIALKSLLKGIDKLILNEAKLQSDLEDNWAVVSEAIQTILRREGFPKPYEALKELTRTNKHIDKKAISDFIDGLNLPAAVKKELHKVTPSNYTGKFEIREK